MAMGFAVLTTKAACYVVSSSHRQDERDLKDYGAMILALDASGIEIMLRGTELTEMECHGQEK
jgi:hypothetical protein